jgi:large subunit ribosomal protein L22
MAASRRLEGHKGMKVEATLKNLRIAPRKVRLVTHSLIGVDTGEALLQLGKVTKKSAGPIETLVKSAIANATNNFGLDEGNLFIREIQVGDGLRLKRWLPRAFGRATPLLRRSAHVTVILEERIAGQNRKAPKLPVAKTKKSAAEEKEEDPEEKNLPPVASQAPKDISKAGPKGMTGKVVKKIFQRKAT